MAAMLSVASFVRLGMRFLIRLRVRLARYDFKSVHLAKFRVWFVLLDYFYELVETIGGENVFLAFDVVPIWSGVPIWRQVTANSGRNSEPHARQHHRPYRQDDQQRAEFVAHGALPADQAQWLIGLQFRMNRTFLNHPTARQIAGLFTGDMNVGIVREYFAN
jgi:hypothetical protein